MINRLTLPITQLGWNAELEIQGKRFQKRVSELLETRPHLSQYDAQNIARSEFRARGQLKKQATLAQKIKMAKKHHASLTLKEKADLKRQWKELPIELADLVVPGLYVARNWTTLETKDKVINIGIDVAAILLSLGLFKLTGAAVRTLSGTTKTMKIAAKAGKVGRQLDDATKTFAQVQKVSKLKVGSRTWVKHTNKIERLQRQSMKADRLFLEQLERLQSISPRHLAKLEQLSGLKGIKGSIQDITKAQRQLSKAWSRVNKLKFNPKAKTPKEIAANNRYLKALAKAEKAQVNLQGALQKAGSILKPRYSYPPSPAEFKGYGIELAKGEPSPKIDASNPDTFKAIESWLARSRETQRTGAEPWVAQTKVAIKPKLEPKGKHRLITKAIYREAKAKPSPKPAVPKVKASVFPGIKAVKKVTTRKPAKALPLEALGRMTAAQIAKYYGSPEREVIDAIANTTIKQLEQAKTIDKLSATEQQQIKTIVNQSIRAIDKAGEEGRPYKVTELITSPSPIEIALIKDVVEEQAKQHIKPVAAVEAITEAIVTTVTEIPVKDIPKLKLPAPRTPRIPLKIPQPTDRDKRRLISKSKGAITFKMGQVGKRDVWYTYMSPYEKPEDKLIVVGRSPVGALVVRGPGSAIRTAQLLYGKTIRRKIMDDVGFMDAIMEPISDKKGIKLSFKPDPLGKTTGDFGISKRATLETEAKGTFPLKKRGE